MTVTGNVDSQSQSQSGHGFLKGQIYHVVADNWGSDTPKKHDALCVMLMLMLMSIYAYAVCVMRYVSCVMCHASVCVHSLR